MPNRKLKWLMSYDEYDYLFDLCGNNPQFDTGNRVPSYLMMNHQNRLEKDTKIEAQKARMLKKLEERKQAKKN